ncbi:MAG: MFS transporter [Candidatus Bathyarchaeota archaeon]|nr:MFS transporter [Candidatus Bathyarchaeota archaeon]
MTSEVASQEASQGLIQRLRSEFDFVQGNFLIMVLSWLVLDFFTELPNTYHTLYVEALGATTTTIGMIGAAQSLAGAFVQIPGGYLADKYGRKWLISSMTFVAALSRIFFVYAPSWEWILLGGVISGLAGIYQPALNAIIADSLPREKRGMGFSIINLITSVSTTPAPLLAGYLFTLQGLVPSMRFTYKLVMIGFFIAALLRTRLTETVEEPTKINVGEMLSEYPTSLRESINVWSLVPRSAFILFLVNIIMNFTSGLFVPVLAFYIIRDLGIGEIPYSYIMTALPVSMIALALPAGKLIDKVGKKKPLMAAFVLWAVAIILLVYGNFYRLILSMVMVGLLMVMANSSMSALFADLVPREHRGKVNGSRGFFSMIAGSFGAIMGGWMYEAVSHQAPFLIEVLLVIPPILMVYFWVEEPEKEETN